MSRPTREPEPEGAQQDEPSAKPGPGHRWTSRVALLALLPLGLAALAAAGPGSETPGSPATDGPPQAAAHTRAPSAAPARSIDVRNTAQHSDGPAPAGLLPSALRPIDPYHTAPMPDPSALNPAGSSGSGGRNGSDASQPNPAALVGDIVHLPAGPLGIPGVMMRAYKHAADLMAQAQPTCHLPWTLLAGIGKIESGHAGGGQADGDGNTSYRILGPMLDGHLAGNAVIHDTDGGAIDGDPHYDRAVGPMQFMPGTWAHFGADGNNDGVADPNNVYDATFAAGRLLCASGADLSDPADTTGAILTYNHSMAYVQNVQAWAHAYATGAYPTPSELPPIGDDDKAIDAPDDLEPDPTPDELPDPPKPPDQDDDTGDGVIPGTDIPVTTIEVPGLPDITVPCLTDCPPPGPGGDDDGAAKSGDGTDAANARPPGALDEQSQQAPADDGPAGDAPPQRAGAPSDGPPADDAPAAPAPPAPVPPPIELPDLQDIIPDLGP